jgi:hypothetical protein
MTLLLIAAAFSAALVLTSVMLGLDARHEAVRKI